MISASFFYIQNLIAEQRSKFHDRMREKEMKAKQKIQEKIQEKERE